MPEAFRKGSEIAQPKVPAGGVRGLPLAERSRFRKVPEAFLGGSQSPPPEHEGILPTATILAEFVG